MGKYKLIVDYGKPYEVKVGSDARLKRELVKLRRLYDSNPDDFPYFDIIIEDGKGDDVTDKMFKKLGV